MSRGWRERLAAFRRLITPASVISTLGYVISVIWTIIEFLRGQRDEALIGGFIGFFTTTMITIIALTKYIKSVKTTLEESMEQVKSAALHAIHGIHLQLTKLDPHLADLLTEQMTMLRRDAEQLGTFAHNKECTLPVSSAIKLLTKYTEESSSSIEATTIYDVSAWYDSQEWYDYRRAQRRKIEDARSRKRPFSIVRLFPLTHEELKDDRIRINMQLQAEYGINVRLMELKTKPELQDFVIFDGKMAIEILPKEETGPHGEQRYIGRLTCKDSSIKTLRSVFNRMKKKATITFSTPEELMNYKSTVAMMNFMSLYGCIEETLRNGEDVWATNLSDIKWLQSEMYELLFLLNKKLLNKIRALKGEGKIKRIFVVEQWKLKEDPTLCDILREVIVDNIEAGIEVYLLVQDDPRIGHLVLEDFFVGKNHFLFINYDPGFGYDDFSPKKFKTTEALPARVNKNMLIATKLGGEKADIDNYCKLIKRYLKFAHEITEENCSQVLAEIMGV